MNKILWRIKETAYDMSDVVRYDREGILRSQKFVNEIKSITLREMVPLNCCLFSLCVLHYLIRFFLPDMTSLAFRDLYLYNAAGFMELAQIKGVIITYWIVFAVSALNLIRLIQKRIHEGKTANNIRGENRNK